MQAIKYAQSRCTSFNHCTIQQASSHPDMSMKHKKYEINMKYNHSLRSKLELRHSPIDRFMKCECDHIFFSITNKSTFAAKMKSITIGHIYGIWTCEKKCQEVSCPNGRTNRQNNEQKHTILMHCRRNNVWHL